MSLVTRQEPNEIMLRDILDLLRRQRVLIIGILAVCVATAVVYCVVAPPSYRSEVHLLVEGKTQTNPEPSFGDPLNQVISDAPPAYDIPTVIEMLERSIGGQIDRDLQDLMAYGSLKIAVSRSADSVEEYPDSLEAQQRRRGEEVMAEQLKRFETEGGYEEMLKDKKAVERVGSLPALALSPQQPFTMTLANDYNDLSIARRTDISAEPIGSTSVVQVNVDSPDPRRAELYATLVQQAFSELLHYSRNRQVETAVAAMETHLTSEEAKLQVAQKALDDYEKKNNVMEAEVERPIRTDGKSRSDLEKALAERDVQAAQKKLSTAIAARRALPEFQESVSTKSNTDNIEAQKKVIADLVAQREPLAAVYQPSSSQIRKLDAQIAKETEYLNSMPKNLVVKLRVRNPLIDPYDTQVTQAEIELHGAEAGAAKVGAWAGDKDADLRKYGAVLQDQIKLQRAVEDAQASVSGLRKNLADLQDRAKGVRDPAIELTGASPAAQVKPNWPRSMALAILVGLALSLALAVVRDRGGDRAVSIGDVDELVGALPLGYIPSLPRKALQAITPNGSIDADVKALPGRTMTVPEVALESYRILRANFNYSTEGAPVRSILVTSTNPGEGKSTVAANLAIAMAADGKRVILVDANLRRPALHKMFHVQESPGLADVLLGRGSLGDVLQATNIAGVSVIAAGMVTFTGSELFGSPTMKEFHEEIIDNCDVAIFDGAQCARVADAQVMSSVAEGVLYVVQLGLPKKASMQFGIGLLKRANAHILGIVYNKLRVNKDNAPWV